MALEMQKKRTLLLFNNIFIIFSIPNVTFLQMANKMSDRGNNEAMLSNVNKSRMESCSLRPCEGFLHLSKHRDALFSIWGTRCPVIDSPENLVVVTNVKLDTLPEAWIIPKHSTLGKWPIWNYGKLEGQGQKITNSRACKPKGQIAHLILQWDEWIWKVLSLEKKLLTLSRWHSGTPKWHCHYSLNSQKN